jgi:hypothetical protein
MKPYRRESQDKSRQYGSGRQLWPCPIGVLDAEGSCGTRTGHRSLSFLGIFALPRDPRLSSSEPALSKRRHCFGSDDVGCRACVEGGGGGRRSRGDAGCPSRTTQAPGRTCVGAVSPTGLTPRRSPPQRRPRLEHKVEHRYTHSCAASGTCLGRSDGSGGRRCCVSVAVRRYAVTHRCSEDVFGVPGTQEARKSVCLPCASSPLHEGAGGSAAPYAARCGSGIRGAMSSAGSAHRYDAWGCACQTLAAGPEPPPWAPVGGPDDGIRW